MPRGDMLVAGELAPVFGTFCATASILVGLGALASIMVHGAISPVFAHTSIVWIATLSYGIPLLSVRRLHHGGTPWVWIMRVTLVLIVLVTTNCIGALDVSNRVTFAGRNPSEAFGSYGYRCRCAVSSQGELAGSRLCDPPRAGTMITKRAVIGSLILVPQIGTSVVFCIALITASISAWHGDGWVNDVADDIDSDDDDDEGGGGGGGGGGGVDDDNNDDRGPNGGGTVVHGRLDGGQLP
jgi:hypothetical protein